MKVATAEQMRRIDARTIKDFGISADALMLEAGRAIATEIRNRFAPARVTIVCGKGNNAGDGFVIARELSSAGIEVDVACLHEASAYTSPAANALSQMVATHVRQHQFNAASAAELFRQSDVIVDAMLGTGIRGALEGSYATAAQVINASNRPVVCVDIPSGLGEFPPHPDHVIVRATLTVTIGLPKVSMFTGHGLQHTGELVVAPIQFPAQLLRDDTLRVNWAADKELAAWLPARSADSNKGTFGSVGVIAGSAQFAGAAILVARAALRAGCGLVTIFCPAQLNSIYKVALPEATTWIVPSKNGQSLDSSSADVLLDKIDRLSVLAVGPGLGTGAEQSQLLKRILEHAHKPLVLDADAITMLAASSEIQHLLKSLPDCILTPHPGELACLLKTTAHEVQSDRIASLDAAVKKLDVNVLLKGAGTLIGKPDRQHWIIRGATSALAKGGTGDVLTGVITSLVAQGAPCWQAAVVGATAHVQAGIACSLAHGTRGVLAGEVADMVPKIFETW